jgi:hypothetical protein
VTGKILYRLSLDPQARELAARVLERCRRLIGDLPASADHDHREPSGFYQHSLELAAIPHSRCEAVLFDRFRYRSLLKPLHTWRAGTSLTHTPFHPPLGLRSPRPCPHPHTRNRRESSRFPARRFQLLQPQKVLPEGA